MCTYHEFFSPINRLKWRVVEEIRGQFCISGGGVGRLNILLMWDDDFVEILLK